MLEIVKETFDVSFYPPSHARHSLYLRQSCVTASIRPETVRVIREHWFVDRFKDKPHHCLKQLIAETGYSQRSHLTVSFGYVQTTGRLWLVLGCLQLCNGIGD